MDIVRKSAFEERPRLKLQPLEQSNGAVPAGSLIISDVFSSTESHGVDVAKAAWNLGFQGPIFYQQAVSEPLAPLLEHQQSIKRLEKPNLERDAAASALHRFVAGPPLHMLLSATDEVDRATESGARNSVLNLSSGTSKAQVTSLLHQHALKGDEPVNFTANLANLFQLNFEELAQGNLQEHARLQQSLIDFVDASWNQESRIEEQRGAFQQAVRRFERSHNSVVIAAGNEGLVEPTLEMQSRADLKVPVDFEQNVLESPDASHVGATIILDGKEAPARYSSSWPGVAFYVSGDEVPGVEFDDSKGLGKSGSSLAAPRVGSLMAEIHRRHPEYSSLEVETTIARQFASNADLMIDVDKARDFLLQHR